MSPRLILLAKALIALFVGVLLGAGLSTRALADHHADSSDEGVVSDTSDVSEASDARLEGAAKEVVPPPIGVRFGEALEGNTVRVSYAWERIRSQGLAVGRDNVTPDYVRGVLGYTQTPRSLEVTVHTVAVAWAPHPRVTLVAEVPFVQKELERVDPSVGAVGFYGTARRQVQTEGIGDVSFSIVIPFIRKGVESSQVHVGFDVPTGSIRRSESTPGGPMILPYDSQIGNGTVDFEWGWTYKGETELFSWGGQALGRHPIGRNGRDYREGSRFTGRLWAGFRIAKGVSASVRTEWEKQNNSEGFDRDLRPTFDPAETSKLQGGAQILVAPGLSIDLPQLDGQRIAFEFGIPVYQDLDGPQLERDWTARAGWQWVY